MSFAPLPPRAVAEVDLDALLANLAFFRRRLPRTTRVVGVVKADAYGHGAVVTAHTLRAAGVTEFAVAALEEAVELREAGITEPIWHLGVLLPEEAPAAVELGLTPTVTAPDQVDALAAASAVWSRHSAVGATGRSPAPPATSQRWATCRSPLPGGAHAPAGYPVHLKVDSGMGRRGADLDTVASLWRRAEATGHLRIEGLCTHFATSDVDPGFAAEQLERFLAARDALAAKGLRAPVVHAANSAALFRFPAAYLDAVRPGISLYGIAAFDAPGAAELQPVLRLTARLVQVRELLAGHEVGYAHGCRLARPTRVGLVGIGYGDGWPWRLSGCGVALVRGVRVPYLGRVNMDLVQLDLNSVPGAGVGDSVVLLGRDGEEAVSAVDLARLAGESEYAVVTQLGRRVTRVWRRGGQLVAVRGLDGKVQWCDD
ncbi:MAG: alanine racemase [Armatimonadetes bacterium]|nr:alanine racemase [Armatimonadota bacterium]